jgi:hypothetical protein
MKVDVKPEPAETTAREESLIALFSTWVQQGTENFFAAQRILLDLVMRQNAIATNALRERLAARGPNPAPVLAEAAGEGFANFIAAEKILLNLAREQNEIVMTGVKERVGDATPAAAMTDLLRRGVENFIDLQQHFLDVAAKQTKTFVEATKTGKPYVAKGFAEITREGMKSFAESQKKFLDLVAEETAKATKRTGPAEKPAKKTQLTELASQSADAFIEAQKKLLEKAGKQVDLNLKTATKAAEAFTPAPGTTFADLTRQGVENFVAAQKALLDVMVKPPAREHAQAAKRAHAH